MRVAFAVARLSAAAWVGAAALFVVTAVREVTHPAFDSATKDDLALLRFPAYYAFGFTLLALAFVSTLGAAFSHRTGSRRITVASGLLALAIVLMAIDFLAVYRPLAEMITPPWGAHSARFLAYHHASVWINVGHVGLCALAAALLCWPDARSDVAAGSLVE